MATRHLPARGATVFDDFSVARPPVSETVLRARTDRSREAYVHEAVPTARARKSLRNVVASIAMTLAQYAHKRAYLRSMGSSRTAARRKALWHIR